MGFTFSTEEWAVAWRAHLRVDVRRVVLMAENAVAGVVGRRPVVAVPNALAVDVEVGVLAEPLMPEGSACEREKTGAEPEEIETASAPLWYAICFAREGRWYESMLHERDKIVPHVSAWARRNWQPLIQFPSDHKTRVYALPLDVVPVPGNVVASVAWWTSAEECLPYIVHHNPMTDPPLVDGRDLLGKAQGVQSALEIFVIVLLPELVALSRDLERGALCRVSYPKNSGFVATLTDMSDFLMRVSSGAITHLALVFPVASRDEVAENTVWQLCHNILARENCRWLLTNAGSAPSPRPFDGPA